MELEHCIIVGFCLKPRSVFKVQVEQSYARTSELLDPQDLLGGGPSSGHVHPLIQWVSSKADALPLNWVCIKKGREI